MSLVNLIVKHNTLGNGVVTKIEGKKLEVKFDTGKETKFIYPDAFEKKKLVAVDGTKQANIMEEISALKQAEREKMEAEIAMRQAAKLKISSSKGEKSYLPSVKIKKSNVTTERIEGKRMVFWVFQGGSFIQEFTGGYMWAPTSGIHHHERLRDVRQGDIILHGCGGELKAVSVAKDACYSCTQPAELFNEGDWGKDGLKVDCDYTEISKPIKTSTYRDDIIRICKGKYQPFKQNGDGNQGYLFEIDLELAKIFISESVKHNSYLAEMDYIQEILAE